MNEVKCMYVSDEEQKVLLDGYATIMRQNSNNSIVNWEKYGENFRQFSIYSIKEVETIIQNKVK